MNRGFIAAVILAVPLLAGGCFLFFIVGATGAAHASRTIYTNTALSTQLRRDSVPHWARNPLQNASHQCAEVTAPMLAAQIDTESDFNPHAYNASSGATGLAQFIPSTWASVGIDADHDGTANPRDPDDAIATQARYDCQLLHDVRQTPGLHGDTTDLMLAAYNAGLGTVTRYHGVPPYAETTDYISKIRSLMRRYATSNPTMYSASAIVKAAAHWIGTPYAWAGGTLTGPSEGAAPDTGIVGFDCSGLTRYAVYQATHGRVTLPRTSQEQYDSTRHNRVPVRSLVPGDLLFYGNPGSIHHVAIYAGKNSMIEAPESGSKIHRVAVRFADDFIGAVRIEA